MFISPAYAQGASAAGGFDIASMLPLVMIFAVFYFLLIRPQQKKAKQHRATLDAIRRGDRVVMGGGIMGTVTKVLNESEIMVEIAEGTRVRVQRGLVATVMIKGQPAQPAQPGAGGTGAEKGSLLKNLLGGGSR